MKLSWQKHRSTFNHDWLKNQYMPALAKYLNLLDDLIEDDEFAVSFISQTLPEWEVHRKEALNLAKSFEREMSPRKLFEHLPLCRSDECTKRWLGEIMHRLWLKRYPIDEWIVEAQKAVENTDIAYEKLQLKLRDGNSEITETPPSLRKSFREFRDRCQNLANALSRFPSEVNVI